MRVDITFNGAPPLVFHNAKSCTFDQGWVHVTDQNDGEHSFPAPDIRVVEKTPTRRY